MTRSADEEKAVISRGASPRWSAARNLSSPRRRLAVLAAVVLVGVAAVIAYEWKAAPPPVPILGVVHQTEIRIAPETSGRLVSFRVKTGQEARKGDVLAVLSSPELAAAVQEGRANAAPAPADKANVDPGVRREE